MSMFGNNKSNATQGGATQGAETQGAGAKAEQGGVHKRPEESAATKLRAEPQTKGGERKAEGGEPSKLAELERLETKWRTHLQSWCTGARVLAEVHTKELYVAKAPSFDSYMREQWGLSASRGHAYIRAARVVENLKDVPLQHLSMAAALKVAPLPDDQQAACLREVIAAAGPSPTKEDVAKGVEAFAKRLKIELKPKPKRTLKCKGRPDRWQLQGGKARLERGRRLTVDILKRGADLAALLEELAAKVRASTPAAAA